jgi:L-amino acid N-acyltransferase YncA
MTPIGVTRLELSLSMVHIRTAAPGDAPAIARVHIESWRTTYRGIVPDAYLDALDIDQRAAMWCGAATMSVQLLVAEQNAEIIGFLCAGPIREAVGNCDAELYAIYLLAHAQHRGIGAALLTELARRLTAQGFKSMAVWVLAANASSRFYERSGATLLAQKEIEVGGVQLPVTAYGWTSLNSILESTK